MKSRHAAPNPSGRPRPTTSGPLPALPPTDFEKLAHRLLSRRRFLNGAAGVGATAFVLGAGGAGCRTARAQDDDRSPFHSVAANTLDTVTVPDGYSWYPVVRWADPMWSDGTPFDPVTGGTASSQQRAFGDNNDGIELFAVGARTLLAVNNEYVNPPLFGGGAAHRLPRNADDVRKSQAAHGVSIVEIRQKDRIWSVVLDSPFNRRITADTPMTIAGPARGHPLLRTAADPSGTRSLGTWNNCGCGKTPWGTFLTCEENFHLYFASSDTGIQISEDLARYGIDVVDTKIGWSGQDERFDLAKHPHEPNRVGYVVEIDPADPASSPRKRTALGRLKHENAELVIADSGQAVVYMGDDEQGEFLYRFVSDGRYRPGGDNADLLDSGTLFTARFDETGHGVWLELSPSTTGLPTLADICIHTRRAASAIGGTTMDRPEWVAVHPGRAEVYCCLTNNKNRGRARNLGGDPMPIDGPNPRFGNRFGQIVRWRPARGDHTARAFSWDLYVVAGNPAVHVGPDAGSSNLTPENMFNSPDGLAFDRSGGLWIQTDGAYSNEGEFAGQGNNQMLRGDPDTGEIRRFLVGPKECEVTGLAWSPDGRTMFVGIQHPGERGGSHFPDGGNTVPRSAVIAVARDDGAPLV